jgi:hypothetical protein
MGAAVAPAAATDLRHLTRGRRCAECRRYLFAFHHPRPTDGRQWEHRRCDGLESPDSMDFTELAEALLARHATARTRQLHAELAAVRHEFTELRFRRIVAEQGGDQDSRRALEAVDADVAVLAARGVAIHEELLEQLQSKARHLQDEWVTGTDANGKTMAGVRRGGR